MAGAENRPGRPVFQQFGERAGTGNALNFVRGLIQSQIGLNLENIDDYCMSWQALTAPSVQKKKGIQTTPEIDQIISQVSRGLDFVLFEKISPPQRGSILHEVQERRDIVGIEQYVLTYEEGLLLRDAAAAVNVSYDPGTPEEVAKRTFKTEELLEKAQNLETWSLWDLL